MSVEIIPRTSEEQWLAARVPRVTATDIARLASGGAAAWDAVKAEKQGSQAVFQGNTYTEWGKEREPVIAAHVEFLHGINPNDSLYVNGGRAATPDGVSDDANSELKTTVRDWAPEAIPRKYLDQVLWAQLVREVDRTLFAWEPHTNFIPGPIRTLWIPRDEKRIEHLIEVEAEFLDYLTADNREPGEFDALIAAAAVAQAELDEKQAELDEVKALIRDRIGDRDRVSAKSPHGSISYFTAKPRESFDATAFKTADPARWAEFVRTTEVKPTLRVTTKGS